MTETMAHLSNNAMYAATIVYTLAMFCHVAEWALARSLPADVEADEAALAAAAAPASAVAASAVVTSSAAAEAWRPVVPSSRRRRRGPGRRPTTSSAAIATAGSASLSRCSAC